MRTLLLALALALALAISAQAASAQSPVEFCGVAETPAPVPLVQLWEEARPLERGYVAADDNVAAEEAGRAAIGREWLPALSLDGGGNWGQRLSPGEERALGVGPRGELRLLGAWTVLDGSRGWRGRAATLRRAEAEVMRDAFDLSYRAELAMLYIDAALADELWQVREEQRSAVAELALPVRRRMEAGVDVTWESHLVEEALARAERLLAEAAQARASARAELSARVARCVSAEAIDPVAGGVEGAPAENLTVLRLLRAAEAHEAMAGVEASRNRWQVQLVGITGPTHSRAFADGPVENEYLLGMNASWTPDFAGVRRQLSAAEHARARSLRAESEAHRALVVRELARLELELEHAASRQAGLERELELTTRRMSVAVSRWEAGVDRWAEVVQAKERVQETRSLQIELKREMALARLRHAEASGDLGALPQGLGQGEHR